MSLLSRLKVGTPVIVKINSGGKMPGVVSFISKKLTYVSVLVRKGKEHRSQDVRVVFNTLEGIEEGLEINEGGYGWLVYGKAVEDQGESVPEYVVLCTCGAKRAGNDQIGNYTYEGWMRIGPPFISEEDANAFISQLQSRPLMSLDHLWP